MDARETAIRSEIVERILDAAKAKLLAQVDETVDLTAEEIVNWLVCETPAAIGTEPKEAGDRKALDERMAEIDEIVFAD